MEDFYELNSAKHKPWKKVLCIILSVIIAFGTFVVLTVGSSRLQDWLGIKSMLSAYAAEIVDTKGAIAVDEESMLADNYVIDLENKDGSNTIYLFSEPISYTDQNGNLKTKDISVEKQTDKELKSEGYKYTNGQNDYRINFSENSDKGISAEFGNCAYSIIPQSDISVMGNKGVSEYLNNSFEVFEYKNIYGEGTNLKFYPQLNGVKDEIVMNENIGQNSFSFELKTENCTAVLNDDSTVSLISNEDESDVQTFSAPFAYDSKYVEGDMNEHYIDCSYTLEKTEENTYILTVTVDSEWLNSPDTVYPVIIDPTTSNISNYKDAGIYSSATSRIIPYGNEATCCFGRTANSEYGYGRVLNYFSWPDAIKKGAAINSAYIWERETTGRTTTTYVAPCLVSEHWVEGSVTWENRPGYYSSTTMARKNINSKSTDKSGDPYWYKFDIASAVKYWADGTYHNYGLLFRSSEEEDGNYNWRAFASKQHSTSSYRPYTVINYTNDATAPTVTSVTGNPTSWTNGNATLTVNGAADNSGGAGLHATPYSFSTTKGSYSWQAAKTKTFSSNCTVYVYVRDALENIRLVSTQTISKIDKTAPSAPTVTGNPTSWTNNDVVLTASSTDSESGIASYSFSITENSYSWQTDNTKTVSANTTYYVYSKDNAGNISDVSIITVNKIDKTAPDIPSVELSNTAWTNGEITLTASANDNLSGVSAYSFSTDPNEYEWQTGNSKTIYEQSKIYVCAKDNVGNISEPYEVDLKIDKLLPTGSVTVEEATDWVKSVRITANATDELSGLHEKAYSFSTEEGVYNWQTDNFKSVTYNGTTYVYARDTAENITLLDTVVTENIDSTAPLIKNVNYENIGDKTVITITSEDAQSGIAGYSIDGGENWQTDNVFEIPIDSLNYFAVKVKDNLDNVSSRYYDIFKPQIYYENGKLGLYSPNPNCQCDIYYKLNRIGAWQKYEKPIEIPQNQKIIYLSFYKMSLVQVPTATSIVFDEEDKFTYSDSSTDLSLTYNSVTFDINRKYENGEWSFSYENGLHFIDNGSLIQVQLPDYSKFYLAKKNKYLYVSETYGYEMSVFYDENDENIVEYILSCGGFSYHYNAEGRLIKFGDKYDNAFTLLENNGNIIITDGANRTTVLAYENDKLKSITDANGGVINYSYDNGNLVKVVDQAGVIIGRYGYTDGKLTKNGDVTIAYDEQGRVIEYLKDNGYSTQLTYTENCVTTTTSDGKTSSITYDENDNITSSTDQDGSVTTYTYDNNQNLITVKKGSEVLYEYSYDSDGRLVSKKDSENEYTYTYDSEGRLIREQSADNDYTYLYDDDDRLIKSSENRVYTYYLYDEDGNVTYTGQIDANKRYAPYTYVEDYTYDSVCKYTYENGRVVKTEDVDNNSVTLYLYDNYGNLIKTTTTVENEDGSTSIGIAEDTYDILNRLVLSESNDRQTSYSYDAAGRTLLINADGEYSRTVYDNLGRVIQEIDDEVYIPELDNLPNAYSDGTAGHTYVYSDANNLISETNKYGITTTYEYYDIGLLYKKSFDIYDYYYQLDGMCDRVDVSGETIVDYDYDVTDSGITLQEGQSLNRATYADGTVESQIYDANGMLYSKLNNGTTYFGSLPAYDETKVRYGNNDNRIITTLTSTDEYISIDKRSYDLATQYQYYKMSTDDNDVTTVEEKHFTKDFRTVINENSISYTSAYGTIDVVYDSNVESDDVSQTVKNGESVLLSTDYTYDEDNDKFYKSYNNDLSFFVQYDNNGNIIADENNSYTYNAYGELVGVSGTNNSSYTYDERGNLLSKTVNGETTSFAYENDNWKDQLTKVNATELAYDANGNLSAYGDREYTWSHGKWLNSITDSENTYSYKYDENGIRASKTVNGATTEFNTLNGVILAQKNSSGIMYFQYDSAGAPVGFVYNDVQYLYITNLSGDVRGITDENGNLIAEYAYDEWGKLISIDAEDEENQAIAELNPLRYRGYYYDNETGYYYLQSRYYDPNICRFISADSFEYLDTTNRFASNAYAYCWNCPIAFDDAEGTTPKLSFDISKIQAFIVKIKEYIEGNIEKTKNKLSDAKDWIVGKWNKMVDFCLNFEEEIKCRFNEFGEKVKFKIHNIYIYINDIYKQITGRDSNLFRIVEFVIEKIHNDDTNADTGNAEQGISLFSLKKVPIVSEAGKVIGVVITEIFTCLDLQEIAKRLNIDFSFNNLQEYMQQKVEIYTAWFDNNLWTAATDFADTLAGYISLGADFVPKWEIKAALTVLPYATSALNDFSGRYISPKGGLIMLLYDWSTNLASGLLGKNTSMGDSILEAIMGTVFGEIFDFFGEKSAINYAYNWYLM